MDNRTIVNGSKFSNSKSAVVLICSLIAILVWIVFGQTIHQGFVNYDDQEYVYENPFVVAGLSFRSIGWPFTHVVSANWQPLTIISHMAACQIFGLWPGGHHLINVLLHMLSGILLFLVLREMTGALWRSAFAAIIFVIHPLRVESVAWISERKDVLSGVFFMLTLWAYVRYTRHRFSIWRYLLVAICFTMALLSKPSVVTLPFLLLLLDYWPLGRFVALRLPQKRKVRAQLPVIDRQSLLRDILRLTAEKFPLVFLSAVSCFTTLLAERGRTAAIEALPFSWRVANAGISYITYLGQLFYPAALAVLYPFPLIPPSHWKVIGAASLLALISFSVILFWRKRPYLFVGWLWFLGTLLPMIGLVQVGVQSHADRHTYLSEIGLYIGLVWSMDGPSFTKGRTRLTLGIGASLIVVALVACARFQTAFWMNSLTLWTRALACTSENAVAQYNLGEALTRRGRTDEALVHIREALRIRPSYAEAHNNLGILLVKKGRYDEASAHFSQAMQILPNDANAYYNMGKLFDLEGRIDDAIAQYRGALKHRPHDLPSIRGLGLDLLQKGRDQEAIPDLSELLERHPEDPDVQEGLAQALDRAGDTEEAILHYQIALKIDPARISILNNLAWLLATNPALRNGSEAVDMALKASQLAGGKNPAILDTLAASYAAAGRYDEAIESASAAIALALSQNEQEFADRIRKRLSLYQSHLSVNQSETSSRP